MVGLAATKNMCVPDVLNFVGQDFALACSSVGTEERAPDRGFQLLRPQRPNQEILGPQANRFQFLMGIVGARQHQHRKIRTHPAQPAQSVQAIGVAGSEIEQNQVGTRTRLDAFQGFPAAAGGFQLPGWLSTPLQGRSWADLFLAHQQNLGGLHGVFGQRECSLPELSKTVNGSGLTALRRHILQPAPPRIVGWHRRK